MELNRRSKAASSDDADARTPAETKDSRKEDPSIDNKYMTRERRTAVLQWYVRRLPRSSAVDEGNRKKLQGLTRWAKLNRHEQDETIKTIDAWIAKERVDLARKKKRSDTNTSRPQGAT